MPRVEPHAVRRHRLLPAEPVPQRDPRRARPHGRGSGDQRRGRSEHRDEIVDRGDPRGSSRPRDPWPTSAAGAVARRTRRGGDGPQDRRRRGHEMFGEGVILDIDGVGRLRPRPSCTSATSARSVCCSSGRRSEALTRPCSARPCSARRATPRTSAPVAGSTVLEVDVDRCPCGCRSVPTVDRVAGDLVLGDVVAVAVDVGVDAAPPLHAAARCRPDGRRRGR